MAFDTTAMALACSSEQPNPTAERDEVSESNLYVVIDNWNRVMQVSDCYFDDKGKPVLCVGDWGTAFASRAKAKRFIARTKAYAARGGMHWQVDKWIVHRLKMDQS